MHSVESDDTSGLFIGTVFVGGINCNEWHTTLRLNNSDVIFKLDTGADANVLPLDVYQQIYSNVPLTPTDTILTAFGDNKIRPEGEVQLEVTCPRTSMTKLLHFYVTRASSIAILGCKACTTMNLVKRVAIGIVEDTTVLTEAGLRELYKDVFTGIGEYAKQYHIETDSSIPPVIQHCRKVPYARYDKLKETLVDLEKKGIIASVDRPTDWVHNLVITEKRVRVVVVVCRSQWRVFRRLQQLSAIATILVAITLDDVGPWMDVITLDDCRLPYIVVAHTYDK